MKEEKNKKSIESLMRRRLDRLRWLKSCCKEVVKCAEETAKKIDAEGLGGNFSCNHDVLKWAERVHRASYELWLLSDVQRLVEEGKEVIEVEVEEINESSHDEPESTDEAR